ncbi:MAG TPA: hypothetical protein GX699_09140 [Firmicutes bacterium]|nr:hypothetical protein [Bacillota bacterium]
MMKRDLVSARREKSRIGGTAFLVRVHFLENSTWQGTIQWLDGRKAKHFRSFYELMMLMNSAVSNSKNADKLPDGNWADDEDEISYV